MNRLKYVVATIVALFGFGSCQNERVADIFDEDDNSIGVSFAVQDFDIVQLRGFMNQADEARVGKMVVFVFDKEGKREDLVADLDAHDLNYRPYGETTTTPVDLSEPSKGKPGYGIPHGGTGHKGLIRNRLSINIKNDTDFKTIVALANYHSRNFQLKDEAGKLYREGKDFAGITTLDQLRKLVLDNNVQNLQYASIDRYNNLFMTAEHTLTTDDIRRRSITLNLVPFVAKVTANIKAGTNVTIYDATVHFENIPSTPRITVGADFPDEKMGYLSSESLPLRVVNNVATIEGYLLPNDRSAKKNITAEDVKKALINKPTGASGFNAFDLRQSQDKKSASGGYFDNGDPVYAPKHATILVFSVYMKEVNPTNQGRDQIAVLTYRIALGDFSGVKSWSNPDAADLLKINNYTIASATHYTYDVKINGFNNVVVEAKATKPEVEPNPSVEGNVVSSNNHYELDSHYEQRSLLIDAEQFGIFKEPIQTGVYELDDNAKGRFLIRTPFEPTKIISYTVAEAENFFSSKGKNIKKTDNDWIRIYVHNPKNTQSGGSSIHWTKDNIKPVLFTETRDPEDPYDRTGFMERTLTVEQFYAWLMTKPKELFDGNDRMAVTIFFNEYFYEKDPMQANAVKDRNLWKTFANAPDRLFIMLRGDADISPDKQSTYMGNVSASFAQHSIKTVFVKELDGVRVWGVESIDEYPNRPFSYTGPNDVRLYYNVYKSNGWVNTWNLMAQDASIPSPGNATSGFLGGYIKYAANNDYKVMQAPGRVKGYSPLDSQRKSENYWQNMTVAYNDGVDVREDWRYNFLSALTRNRDNDRNGYMEASEMQWYIPDQMQVLLLGMSESVFPGYARLGHKRPKPNNYNANAPLALFTSTMYRNNAVGMSSANPLMFVPRDFATYPLYDLLSRVYGTGITWSRSINEMYVTMRMVRDLGVIETADGVSPRDSYHLLPTEINGELNKFMRFTPKYADPAAQRSGTADRTTGKFVADGNFTPALARTSFVSGELPYHTELDAAIRVYYKGFQVAGSYAYNDPAGTTIVKRYGFTFDEFASKMGRNASPCAGYSERPDKTDMGKWRVPNILELALMGVGMPRPYWYRSLEVEDGTVKKAVWSRTAPSYTNYSAKGYSGEDLFLYIDQQIFWPMSLKVPFFGEPVRSWEGYVRCVRDLESLDQW